MKGYKVFNPDWTCRGFHFEVGKTYEEAGKPICGKRGFHFCTKLIDCFIYTDYAFDPHNKVAEIEAIGNVDDNSCVKYCTNKIKIIRELAWSEVLDMVNSGDGNSGYRNSGDGNSGYRNSGDCNSGRYNSGDWNSGDCNSGDGNSGDCNSGDCNSGRYNSGDWNSGDWNKANHSSGCFCTEEQKINMFNKPSNWTYRDWIHSEASSLLREIKTSKWIPSKDMTDEEKSEHPEHLTTGGYLKQIDIRESAKEWWDNLSDRKKGVIKSLPNFDSDIFEQITGIKVED